MTDSTPTGGTLRGDLLSRLRAQDQEIRIRALSMGPPLAFESELTLQQLRVLACVVVEPGTTTTALRKRLGVSAPTVSGLVDRLVEQGLVERRHDADDRRVRHLLPTDQGVQAITDLDAMNRALFDTLVSVLTDEELRATVGTYASLLRAMDRLGVPQATD